MDQFSLEDFLTKAPDQDSPGTYLYLYRLLHLLASGTSFGSDPAPLAYPEAKKLAHKLGLNTPERLAALIEDFGTGPLKLEIGKEGIQALISPRLTPPDAPPREQAGCELERGLIDGSLELITGLPVTTVETHCWTRGDGKCAFEACRDESGVSPRFVPMPASGVSNSGNGQTGLNPANLKPDTFHSWFMDLTGRELARARRHGRPVSLLYIDLDDLREINSRHGRDAGDRVINAVAAALGRSCRTEDYLWHPGEDEFAVILSETGIKEAEIVARRLVTEILSAAGHIEVPAKVSASIGFSTFPTHAGNVPDLFSGARSALYLAKSLGKGRASAAKNGEAGKAEAMFAATGAEPEHPHPGTEKDLQTGDVRTVGAERAEEAFEPVVLQEAGGGSASAPDAETPAAARRRGEPEEQPFTVLVASSGPLLIAGMKQVLSDQDEIKVIDEISDSSRLPATVADQRPDLILADLQMATAGDFETLKLIRDKNLPCKFVVLATNVDQDVIRLAAEFFIDGVILQNSPPQEIISALSNVYNGRAVLPEEVKTAISELEDNRRLLEELSERELQVLKLVAEGKSNSQISEELFITVNTVRFHLANVFQKLGVSNRTEAANCYLRQDLSPDAQTRLL